LKPFEIQYKDHQFYKYERTPRRVPEWQHHKYYRTIEGATDAIRQLRENWSKGSYMDYPAMGNIENEAKYPHLTPTITVRRYRIVTTKPPI